MVRLNTTARRNAAAGESNAGGLGGLVTFWGMVGATMTALKMKDKWDEYRAVPSESGVNSPAPPAYRDDEFDSESAIGLDTSINVPHRQKRKRNCCMCCGLNCTLFCKAFGIVVLLFVVWNGIKLIKWAITPSPTGLEGMPEYSTSLGCLDAPHFYEDNHEGIFYTIPVGEHRDHDLLIGGGAVGTLVLAPSTSVDNDIRIRATVRSNDASAIAGVVVQTPASGSAPPAGARGTSYFSLSTPAEVPGKCARYDVTVYIPLALHRLRIAASSVVQVKYDFGDDVRVMSELDITLSSAAGTNLLLPSDRIIVEDSVLDMSGGYAVGTVSVLNSTTIDTRSGDATAVLTLSATRLDGSYVYVSTLTGTGRSDFVYVNPLHRAVHSEHTSYGLSDSELRLTYDKARFNGRVEVDARSYSMRGVQSGGRDGERWVGDKDAGDLLKVSTKGWVGIYF
ncbi:hypothetical protein M0805_002044 [Coniferiporia weirii]|nr:hypothetical protein M0805_002044 [Coniferiporia weirii]